MEVSPSYFSGSAIRALTELQQIMRNPEIYGATFQKLMEDGISNGSVLFLCQEGAFGNVDCGGSEDDW